jgi:hypothetical protein
MSEAQRRYVSVAIAFLAFVILTPNLVAIVQQVWQTYVQPPAFGYDYEVSVPQCSGIAEGDMYGYQGVQKYKLPGLSVIYQFVDSIPSQQNILLPIKLERDQVTIGNNVTFLVAITFARAEDTRDLALYVFLSDPRGIVRGAFPDGKIAPNSTLGYPYLSYYKTMQQGRLAFTFRIPQDSLSVGDWTIFVLGAEYIPTAPSRYFLAWNAVTFRAAEPPRVEQNITSVLESFKSFGIAFSAYAFVSNYFKSLSAGFSTLRKNKWFVLGIALIVIYAVFAFVFQR